jgi:hypothetical protein
MTAAMTTLASPERGEDALRPAPGGLLAAPRC